MNRQSNNSSFLQWHNSQKRNENNHENTTNNASTDYLLLQKNKAKEGGFVNHKFGTKLIEMLKKDMNFFRNALNKNKKQFELSSIGQLQIKDHKSTNK